MTARFDELCALYAQCFPEDSAAYRERFLSGIPGENVFTAIDGGRVVSAGYLVEKSAVFRGEPIKVGYLSALGTLEDYRGRGIVGGVIAGILRELCARKIPFAALNPFRFGYYERYGFLTASHCEWTTVYGGRKADVRRVGPEDMATLVRLYEEFSGGFDLRLKPSEEDFARLNAELALDGGGIYLVTRGGEPVAFVAVDGEEITHYAAKNFDDILCAEPLKGLKIADFHGENSGYIQLRIASVEAFLGLDAYKQGFGEFVAGVADSLVPANNGVFSVREVAGKRSVSRVNSDAESTVTVDDLLSAFLRGKALFSAPKIMFQDKF